MNERVIYQEIDKYLSQYNALPTKEALLIELDNNTKVSDENFSKCSEMISELNPDPDTDKEWLIEKTEKFCQEKQSIMLSWNQYLLLTEKRNEIQDQYQNFFLMLCLFPLILLLGMILLMIVIVVGTFIRVEERIPFDLDYLNKITKGGVPKKSLNIILAGTGVGKSLAMCHMASANLLDGKNVLYVTMEMAEEKIAERIDANLLNVSLEDLANLPKQMYDRKLDRVKGKTSGKLIVKEYPTASAHVGHFRHLLNELRLKRQFIPDIIYVDYLNICMSHRIRTGSNVNSYTLVKSIAEELRGLAVEKNVPIISATQTTRSGYTSSDVGLEDTSESFGLPATADFMVALISTEELEDLNQIMVKQLKNRYNDPTIHKRFVVGVDRAKMRLYDVEQSAQDDVLDGPVFDNTTYAERADEEDKMKWATKKMGKKDFTGFKV